MAIRRGQGILIALLSTLLLLGVAILTKDNKVERYCDGWYQVWDEPPIGVSIYDHWQMTGVRGVRTNKLILTTYWMSDGLHRFPKRHIVYKSYDWPELIEDFDMALFIARDVAKRHKCPIDIRVTVK